MVLTNEQGVMQKHILFGGGNYLQGRYGFHEMVHFTSGLGDIDLARSLGLGEFSDGSQASQAIQDYFDDTCDPDP